MSYRKEDILFLGTDRHEAQDGTLLISFEGKAGTSDLIVLREVLALFGAEVTGQGAGYRKDGHNHRTVPNHTGYSTTLPFAELAKLDGSKSFPRLVEQQEAARQKEVDKVARIKAAEKAARDKLIAEREEREERQRQRHMPIG